MEHAPNFPDKQNSEALRKHIHSLIHLDPVAAADWTSGLRLEFVMENEPGGNLCLAYSHEIRDDYRSFFTADDLVDYLYAALQKTNKYNEFLNLGLPALPQPRNVATFWKLVRQGNQMRKAQPPEGTETEIPPSSE